MKRMHYVNSMFSRQPRYVNLLQKKSDWKQTRPLASNGDDLRACAKLAEIGGGCHPAREGLAEDWNLAFCTTPKQD